MLSMHRLLFIREFLRHWREVGSITPSSDHLNTGIAELVSLPHTQLGIELGAGLGGTTKELLIRLPPGARLYAFEINPAFSKVLRNFNNTQLNVICDDVLSMLSYMKPCSADYVASGIPLATLSLPAREKLLHLIFEVLKPGGVYVQFQYSLMSRNYIEKIFDKVETQFIPLNIPPAFIFIVKKR